MISSFFILPMYVEYMKEDKEIEYVGDEES